MFFIFLAIGYDAFPLRDDSILSKNINNIRYDVSGSLGLYLGDNKCQETYPNSTLSTNRKLDWCSNIPEDESQNPWIQYSIPGQAMRLTGYSVRNGCCYYACCCNIQTGKLIDGSCCCELYSFSLQGSNDNITWKVIHRVEKSDYYFDYCFYQTYNFPMTESFNFIRFVLEGQRKGCAKCMQINEMEFYGKTTPSSYYNYGDSDESDESISIIGKIKRND